VLPPIPLLHRKERKPLSLGYGNQNHRDVNRNTDLITDLITAMRRIRGVVAIRLTGVAVDMDKDPQEITHINAPVISLTSLMDNVPSNKTDAGTGVTGMGTDTDRRRLVHRQAVMVTRRHITNKLVSLLTFSYMPHKNTIMSVLSKRKRSISDCDTRYSKWNREDECWKEDLESIQEIFFDPCNEGDDEEELEDVISEDGSNASWLQRTFPDVACMVSNLKNGLDFPPESDIPSDDDEECSSLCDEDDERLGWDCVRPYGEDATKSDRLASCQRVPGGEFTTLTECVATCNWRRAINVPLPDSEDDEEDNENKEDEPQEQEEAVYPPMAVVKTDVDGELEDEEDEEDGNVIHDMVYDSPTKKRPTNNESPIPTSKWACHGQVSDEEDEDDGDMSPPTEEDCSPEDNDPPVSPCWDANVAEEDEEDEDRIDEVSVTTWAEDGDRSINTWIEQTVSSEDEEEDEEDPNKTTVSPCQDANAAEEDEEDGENEEDEDRIDEVSVDGDRSINTWIEQTVSSEYEEVSATASSEDEEVSATASTEHGEETIDIFDNIPKLPIDAPESDCMDKCKRLQEYMRKKGCGGVVQCRKRSKPKATGNGNADNTGTGTKCYAKAVARCG
jgi:hypothetical protein